MSASNNCPNRDELFSYQVGTLTEDRAEGVLDHLGICPDCQSTLDTLDLAKDTLIARLRQPVRQEAFADDPQRREAFSRAMALAGPLAPGDENRGSLPSEPAAAGAVEPIIPSQLGEYELLAKLGQGGMGTVYKARQTKLKRIIALKLLAKGRMGDDRAIARFDREMEAVGQLNHPNIVQAHDAREIDGTPVLAMEYVEGLNLSQLVDRVGRLPVADACELIRQAAEGLQAAHAAGLVHRDIKPSNIMLTPTGTVKILDLGLALLGTSQPDAAEMTSAGQTMGTADYMAPEQTFDSHQVDHRADIYSLGCTLFKLLTGRAPFTGSKHTTSMAKMMAHVQEPVPNIAEHRPEVPEPLAAILARMMAKSPADRFPIPAEVSNALAPLATESDLPKLAATAAKASPPTVDKGTSPANTDPYPTSALASTQSNVSPTIPPRRPRRWLIAAAMAPLFLVALGVILWINNTRIEVQEGSIVTVKPDGSIVIETPTERTAVPFAGIGIGASPDVVLKINNGDEATTSREVNLSISTEESDYDPVQMRFCMNGWTEASFTEWEPYQPTNALTLPNWQGKNYVGVQLRDEAGNIKGALETIVLKSREADSDRP